MSPLLGHIDQNLENKQKVKALTSEERELAEIRAKGVFKAIKLNKRTFTERQSTCSAAPNLQKNVDNDMSMISLSKNSVQQQSVHLFNER